MPTGFLDFAAQPADFRHASVSKSETPTIASGQRPAWTMASAGRSAAAWARRRPSAGALEAADHHVAEERLVAADVVEFAVYVGKETVMVVDPALKAFDSAEDGVPRWRHGWQFGSPWHRVT